LLRQDNNIGLSLQELTSAWASYNRKNVLAPTQKLGHALFKLPDVEGFLSPSAKVPDEKNLHVFPVKILKESRSRFRNPLSGKSFALKGP
jgi:hypothetical protein